jgi:ribosomal protein S18 acetylase RimI-like enzyme
MEGDILYNNSNIQRTSSGNKNISALAYPDLYFRSVEPTDRQQIQELHEQWFPVTYQDEFYDSLVLGRLCANAEEGNESSTTDDCDEYDNAANNNDKNNDPTRQCPLYTCLAVVANTHSDDRGASSLAGSRNRNIPRSGSDLSRMEEARLPPQPAMTALSSMQSEQERVVACVVGAFVRHSILSTELRALLVPDPLVHTQLFYIMTLGAADDYRNIGLSTFLVHQCMEQVQAEPSCGTLYLHVLDTNVEAIRFYEKLGFYRVKIIPNYYSIHGQLRNCFLYAKYFHGACVFVCVRVYAAWFGGHATHILGVIISYLFLIRQVFLTNTSMLPC